MAEALRATGRWPVLLSLVHGAVRDAVKDGGGPGRRAARGAGGAAEEGVTALDATNPGERSTAVAATIGVSLRRLTPDERARYRELAVFGEDVAIPGEVVARLWAHTGGWTRFQARRLCRRLFDLGLLAGYRRNPDRLVLHDVIRAYLRDTSREQRAEWDAAVVDAHRDLLPPGGGLGRPARRAGISVVVVGDAPVGAGRRDELEAVLADPRWLVRQAGAGRAGGAGIGPAAVRAADVAGAGDGGAAERPSARPARPARVVGRDVRLPAARPHRPRRAARADPRHHHGPHLRGVAPLPDLPHDALLRVLTGHTGGVAALAVAPDGTWLASAGHDGTVRIWDPHTGQARHTLTGHTGAVRRWRSPRTAPGWPPPAATTATVRIWDPHTGQTRHTLTGHTGAVEAVAVAPDGTWLASASGDGTVRIWDPPTGQVRHTLTGHTGAVAAVAVAPDGTWLATAGDDGTVRIWDPPTGQPRHTLTGHTGAVSGVAVAPDGTWLATAGGRRRDGADLGPAHRADPPHPHRPHRRGGGGGGRPGRHLAGLRRQRRRRCGSGTRTPASPATPSPATPAG